MEVARMRVKIGQERRLRSAPVAPPQRDFVLNLSLLRDFDD